MARFDELAGVAHDIAHHAGSGVSHLSPHMSQALKSAGASTASVELLSEEPYPSNATHLEPLRQALLSLRETALTLLATHHFSASDVTSVLLHATPAPWDDSGHSLHTRAVITSGRGRIYDSGWLQ